MDPTERALKQITTIQIEESKPIRLPDHSLGVTSYRARRRNDYQLRLDHAHYLKFTQGGISVKDKVVFEMNVPVEVCLAHAEGKEIGGRRGEQIMFDLDDGRLMFVPQSVRDQIGKLEVKPGERFQVCKREVDNQGDGCFEWTVNRLASQAPKAQLMQSANNGSAAPVRSASTNNNGASGHAGNEAAPKKNGQARLSYIMQMALQGALDATLAVERYAEDSGIIDRNGAPFRFSNDDIRAIGLTMFIEARKRAW